MNKYYEEVGSQIFCLSNIFNEIEIGENKVLEKRPIIKMSESILLNPNSYKNIHHVLKQVKIFAKIGTDREWVFIGCDGPPYCLASRIVECSPDEFDFAAIVPGLGDLHMNQMKTMLRIVDDILLEPLGKEVLNFNSDKAYYYFVNAKDTHKSWQAIQVLLFGTTLKLLREYIRVEGEQPSVLRFLEWQADQECNNLKLVSQVN